MVPIRCWSCWVRVGIVETYCTTGSYSSHSAAGRQKTSWSSQVHRGAHLLLNYFTGRGLLPMKADPALKGYCKGTITLFRGRWCVQRNQSWAPKRPRATAITGTCVKHICCAVSHPAETCLCQRMAQRNQEFRSSTKCIQLLTPASCKRFGNRAQRDTLRTPQVVEGFNPALIYSLVTFGISPNSTFSFLFWKFRCLFR